MAIRNGAVLVIEEMKSMGAIALLGWWGILLSLGCWLNRLKNCFQKFKFLLGP